MFHEKRFTCSPSPKVFTYYSDLQHVVTYQAIEGDQLRQMQAYAQGVPDVLKKIVGIKRLHAPHPSLSISKTDYKVARSCAAKLYYRMNKSPSVNEGDKYIFMLVEMVCHMVSLE